MSDAAIRSEAEFAVAHAEAAAASGTLVECALALGARAADPAWVFAAGYQCAIRDVFGADTAPGLRCLAASEPADAEPTRLARTADGFVLRGRKSWIAHAAVVDTLVVTAREGDARCWVLVPNGTPGLVIDRGATARFLPALSQGTASFDTVHVDDAAIVREADTGRRMRAAEPRFVRLALAGRMRSAGVLDEADLAPADDETAFAACLRRRTDDLLAALDETDTAAGEAFRANGRLFDMFLGPA